MYNLHYRTNVSETYYIINMDIIDTKYIQARLFKSSSQRTANDNLQPFRTLRPHFSPPPLPPRSEMIESDRWWKKLGEQDSVIFWWEGGEKWMVKILKRKVGRRGQRWDGEVVIFAEWRLVVKHVRRRKTNLSFRASLKPQGRIYR